MTENNKLIAEFIGGYQYDNHDDFITFDETNNMFSYDTISLKNLKFHSDWNWLMEVVEKINDLNNVVEIHENHVRVVNNERSEVLVDVVEGSMLEATYNACVEFVKLYNQNK